MANRIQDSAELTVAQALTRARQTVPEIVAAHLDSELRSGTIDLLLDVREPAEWTQGHVPGAVHAPRGLLEWQADPASPAAVPALMAARGGRVVVMCASGGRSLLAAETLAHMGYADVSSLSGGINSWKAAGLPITAD